MPRGYVPLPARGTVETVGADSRRATEPGLASLDVQTDEEYHAKVEALAHEVVNLAAEEGWLTYLSDDEEQTPLQQAINELARNLRHVHHEGDGCLDEDDE
jgi:hypothetical protein